MFSSEDSCGTIYATVRLNYEIKRWTHKSLNKATDSTMIFELGAGPNIVATRARVMDGNLP